jgi:hypothetical protein
MPIAESCSMRSGDSIAALLRWLLIHAPSLSSWTSGAIAVLTAARVPVLTAEDDPFDVLPGHAEVSLAFVVLLGGGVVERPFVGLLAL